MERFTFEEAQGAPAGGGGTGERFSFDEAFTTPEDHGRFFLNLREGWRGSLPGIVQSHVESGRNLDELANDLELSVQAAKQMGRPNLPEYGEFGGAPKGALTAISPWAGQPVADAERMRDTLRAEAQRRLGTYQKKRGAEIEQYQKSPFFWNEPSAADKVLGFLSAAGGQVIGGLPDPINLIPGGRGATALRSFGRGALAVAPAAAGLSVAQQAQEQNLGLRDQINFGDVALSGAVGGATGGTLGALPQTAQWVRSLFGTPETRAPRTVADAFQTTLQGDQQLRADFERHRPILEAHGITDATDPRAPKAIAALNVDAQRPPRLTGLPEFTTGDKQSVDAYNKAVQAQEQARADVESGARSPQQMPEAGLQMEQTGPNVVDVGPMQQRIIAGNRPGQAYRETPGAEIGRKAFGITEEQVALIAERSGLDPETIRGLSEAGQGRLFEKYGKAAAEDATRAEAGKLTGTDVRAQDPQGEGATSYPSKPNVPGDRAAPPSREFMSDAEIAAQEATPQARKAAQEKATMLDELDALRRQRDALNDNERFRDLRRQRDTGGGLEQKAGEELDKLERQRAKLDQTVFDTESRIYQTEARSELGSKAASGVGDRPFRDFSAADRTYEGRLGGDAQPGETRAQFFERTAREGSEKLQKEALDKLEREWAERERMRKEREASRDQAQGDFFNDAQARERYAKAPLSGKAAKPEGSRYTVDQDGYVMSDKGGPVHFKHQRDAGWWILKTGNKAGGDQLFEIANHPGGKGFTVRQSGKAEGASQAGRQVVPAGPVQRQAPRQGGENAPQGRQQQRGAQQQRPRNDEQLPGGRQDRQRQAAGQEARPGDRQRGGVPEGAGRQEPRASGKPEEGAGRGQEGDLARVEVEVPVREAETGRIVRVKERADRALAEVDERLSKLRTLWECLNA